MYLPPAFAEDRLEVKHGLIQAFPLGTLIVHGRSGLSADLVPFLLYGDEGGQGVLRAHVARANPVWQELEQGADFLVQFTGPEAYVSPNWYAAKQVDHKVVPTWNYAAVQVRGQATVQSDSAWLRRLLDDLTALHERELPAPWSTADAPPGFIDTLSKAIVGIEVEIAEITGKWKVSQNRPAPDQRTVAQGLQGRAPGMAALVTERFKPE
ncbi:FMN-binding negative transcriptional regulator [Massilia endophytica]|uniref:FMN-binding negative transcriptional regulator n=1 Tax=Massilia endophytica TaxID=2899220 RepID=UPI001E4376EA|nr:FMN-binding negative transcriptional regulator [Massilia endophytica]UGQ48290.1 FMN-binding negative transcriptional regulator [Massilia endophytica]